MRNILILLLFVATAIKGQIRVGDFKLESYSGKKLNIDDLERFRNSETIFILPDLYTKDTYQKLLNEVWDITPFKIYYAEEISIKMIKEDQSIVNYRGIGRTKRKIGSFIPSSSSFFAYLKFTVVDNVNSKKGKWSSTNLGAIYFTPGASIISDMFFSNKNELTGNLVNFKYLYLKNNISQINQNLKDGISIDFKDDYINTEIKSLESEKLYIDINIFTDRASDPNFDMKSYLEEKLDSYNFAYEILPYQELERLILDSDESIYYLMVNQFNSYKVINVINGKTGKIIYQDVTNMSYQLKGSDFKKLEQAINEAE